MVEVTKRFILALRGFFFCFGGGADRVGFDRFDHDVARGMFKRSKFNHGDMVAAGLQFESAQSVCQIYGQEVHV